MVDINELNQALSYSGSQPQAQAQASGSLVDDLNAALSYKAPRTDIGVEPPRVQIEQQGYGGMVADVAAQEGRAIGRSFLKTLASTPQGVGVLASKGYNALVDMLPENPMFNDPMQEMMQSYKTGEKQPKNNLIPRPMDVSDSFVGKATKTANEFYDRALPKGRSVNGFDNFFSETIPEGMGSMLAFLIGGKSPASIAGISAAQSASAAYDEGRAAGLNEKDSLDYGTIVGAVSAATEPVPFSDIGERLLRASPAVRTAVGRKIVSFLTEKPAGKIAGQAFEEAIPNEFVQGYTQKVALESKKNPTRPLGEIAVETLADKDVWIQAAAGGVLGGFMGAMLHSGPTPNLKEGETPKSVEDGIKVWIESNPEAAKVVSQTNTLSRDDFENLTGEKGRNKAFRDAFVEFVKSNPPEEVSPDASTPSAVPGEVIQSPSEVPAEAAQPTGEQEGGEAQQAQHEAEETEAEEATEHEEAPNLTEEQENAQQIAEAGQNNEGGSPRPEVRQEGGNPAEGGAGVRQGGQEEIRQKELAEMSRSELGAEAKNLGLTQTAGLPRAEVEKAIRQEEANQNPPLGPEREGEPIKSTRIVTSRMDDVKAFRRAVGYDVDSPEKRGWAEDVRRAIDQKMVERASDIAQQVIKDPKPISSIESAAIEYRSAQLLNMMEEQLKVAEDPDADIAERTIAEAEYHRNASEVELLTRAQILYGSERGRALASQRRGITEDFRIVPMMARAKMIKGGGAKPVDLTTSEREKLEQLAKENEQLTKRIEELEKSREKAANEKDFKSAKRRGKKRDRTEIVSERNGLIEKARGLLRAGCDIS